MNLDEIMRRRRRRHEAEGLRKIARLQAATFARGRATGLTRALELAVTQGWPASIRRELEAEARDAAVAAREAEERSKIR